MSGERNVEADSDGVEMLDSDSSESGGFSDDPIRDVLDPPEFSKVARDRDRKLSWKKQRVASSAALLFGVPALMGVGFYFEKLGDSNPNRGAGTVSGRKPRLDEKKTASQ